jgi:hypothetical protein
MAKKRRGGLQEISIQHEMTQKLEFKNDTLQASTVPKYGIFRGVDARDPVWPLH